MRRFWRRFAGEGVGGAAFAFLLLLLVLALLAPVLFSQDPGDIGPDVMMPPSASHVLGTDDIGRDIWEGIVYGTRVSLAVGLLSALGATVVGSAIGAIAGYFGGWADMALMRVTEIFQVVPSFVLAALIVALSGPGVTQIIIVISILSWPQTARLMRGEVMRIRHLEFVDAVRCMGEGEMRLLLREVVPNAMAPILVVGTLTIGQAILLETGLSFFGLDSPDVISWGRMLATGQRFLASAWWISLFPGLAILLTVLAFNLVGDSMGAVLDPRRSRSFK
jgi:peptide/nickel transport system permease protein